MISRGAEHDDGGMLDVVAVVVALPRAGDDPGCRTAEHRTILALCQQQVTVADIAGHTGLPLAVVRVVLSDLILAGAITVLRQRPAGPHPGNDVLQEIIDGLRAL